MENKQDNTQKRGNMFGRLRGSILSGPGRYGKLQGQSPELSPPPDGELEEKAEKIAEKIVRNAISVPTESVLYSLWKEWDKEMNKEMNKEEDAPGLMEVRFREEDLEKAHVGEAEIEMEKKKVTLTLTLRARHHFQATRPDEGGNVPDIDAEVVVHVSKNRMGAWALAFPPSGRGKAPDRSRIELALMEYSVSEGIDEEAIEGMARGQTFFQLVLVACGTPPTEGKDGYVIEKYPRDPERVFRVNEQGKVDYRVQNNVQEIVAGDVICEMVPPVEGRDGVDVMGAPVRAKAVKAARFPAGKNTAKTGDRRYLVASMDGHLQYKGDKFHVEPTFYVRGNVDMGVGNINYMGDVHVAGDVLENFVIKASGSVYVDGLVEGAVIEAGGDVIVRNGILGNDKTVIKAGGGLQAAYIESGIVYAGGDVQAGSIIASEIHSDNDVRVRSGRGTIIGGRITAGRQIDAGVIGSRAERLTALTVGELSYVKKQIEEILLSLQHIAEEKADIAGTLGRIEAFDVDQLTPELAQAAADYRLRKAVLGVQEQRFSRQLASLRQKQEGIAGCKITAGTVFPVTEVRIMEQTTTIYEKITGSCNIHIADGEIVTV